MALRNDGSIHHFAAVRLRVTGSGNLRMTMYSLNEAKSTTLNPIEMVTSTADEPTKGANFKQNRAAVDIRTTGLGEYFRISKIVVFAKVSASGRPG